MEFLEWLHQNGGVCTLQAAKGRLSNDELVALRGTRIWSPMRGWLALIGLRNDTVRALEAGGVASCVTAFARHGLWVPHGAPQLHVRVRRHTHSDRVAKSRASESVVVHAMHTRFGESRPTFGCDGPLAALAVASGCVRPAELIAATDAALARGLVRHEDVRELALTLPRRRGESFAWANGKAGSGSESEFATCLRRAGVAFRQQVQIVPSERVDFLIGKSLVVEIDSSAWHGSRAQMTNDRRRDAELLRRGYHVVRFTYDQVLFEPGFVIAVILDLVRRRVHLRQPW